MTALQQELLCQLMHKLSSIMLQYAYRKTGDAALAEDLVQAAFLAACTKAAVLEYHPKPAAWLYDTLNKLILRELSKAYHSREFPIHTLDSFGREPELLKLADHLPHGLTSAEQELILLRVEDGLSHREIAEQKGISEAACRQRVSRALQKCRKLMTEPAHSSVLRKLIHSK